MSNNRTNRNAVIVSRTDRNGNLRTETQRRDANTTQFAVSTDNASNSTSLFIDFSEYDTVKLSGSEARTLYRLLQKHYGFTGKTT